MRSIIMSSVGLVLVIALAACDESKAESGEGEAKGPEAIEKVEGKVTIGGKEAKVTSCTTKALAQGTALELELDNGVTVISSAMDGMRWRKADGEPQSLDCEKMASDARGGKAPGGAWTVGKLAFACAHPDGKLEADLSVDCGVASRPSNAK